MNDATRDGHCRGHPKGSPGTGCERVGEDGARWQLPLDGQAAVDLERRHQLLTSMLLARVDHKTTISTSDVGFWIRSTLGTAKVFPLLS